MGGLLFETGLAYYANKVKREIAEGKTTIALEQVRVNQARFRRAILASYNATCCMSGLRMPQLRWPATSCRGAWTPKTA
jgi:hypothetical protein